MTYSTHSVNTCSHSGLVLAFNVSCNKAIASLATQRHVTVLSHNVIYKLVELLKVCGGCTVGRV